MHEPEPPHPSLSWRQGQKLRTRDRIIRAVADLRHEGAEINHAAVARRADVDRRTVARHFPNAMEAMGLTLPEPYIARLVTAIEQQPPELTSLWAFFFGLRAATAALTDEEEKQLQELAIAQAEDPDSFALLASTFMVNAYPHALALFMRRAGRDEPNADDILATHAILHWRSSIFDLWRRDGFSRRMVDIVDDLMAWLMKVNHEISEGVLLSLMEDGNAQGNERGRSGK